MPITDPRSIASNKAWYSAEYEALFYTDGQEMTVLHDASGNGNNLTGATVGTMKPRWYATGGPNNGPRIRFDNGGYFVSGSPPHFMTGFSSYHMIDYRKSDYLVTGTTQGSDKLGDHVSTSDHYGYDGGVYDGFASTGRKGPVTPPAALNVWHRHEKFSAANDWGLFHNDTSYGATGSNTVAFKSVGGFTIGNGGQTPSNTATDTWEGDRTLIVLSSARYTTQQQTDMRAWIDAHLNGGTPAAPPNVPTGLAATPTTTTIPLTWVAPVAGDAPTGYNVRIDAGATVDSGADLAHTFTGLTPGSGHTVEVQAYNAAGASAWVPLAVTTTLATPTALAADAHSTDVDLSWAAVTGATGYDVRVNGGAETAIGNVLTHNYTGLTPDTIYTLEVRATTAGAVSAWATLAVRTDPLPGVRPQAGTITNRLYDGLPEFYRDADRTAGQ